MNSARDERRSSRRRLLGTAAATGLLAAGLRLPKAQPAAAQEFTAAARRGFANNTPISIFDHTTASPYPSIINVSGMPGSVTKVQVGIHGLTHVKLPDIQMALVSPTGTSTWLMGTVGDLLTSRTNMELLFDDNGAAIPLAPFNSGVYKPTNYDATKNTIFPFPAPQPITAISLSVFNGLSGTALNGGWQLYVLDALTAGAGGIVGGWSLVITTTNSRPVARNDSYEVERGERLIVPRPGVLKNDRDPDDDRLSVIPFSQQSRLGRIVVKANGSLRFYAHRNRTGAVSFTYTVRDREGLTDTARIRIRVLRPTRRRFRRFPR